MKSAFEFPVLISVGLFRWRNEGAHPPGSDDVRYLAVGTVRSNQVTLHLQVSTHILGHEIGLGMELEIPH